MSGGTSNGNTPGIGYVMLAYARVDDAFITNEIYLLERLGLRFHIYSVKQPRDSARRHASVDQIQAGVTSLPDLGRSSFAFLRYLRQHWRGHVGVFARRPGRYLRTLAYTLGLHMKYRLTPRARRLSQEQFLVDFLCAGPVALHVLESPWIHHLHGHFAHASTTVTMLVSRLTGVPFSFTAHAKDIYLPRFHPGDLLQQKVRGAAFVVTCTEQNRAYLKEACPDAKKLHCIYHGIDTAVFPPRAEENGNGSVPRILTAGRFVEKKGFPYLVRACRVLKDRGHVIRCDIIGRPDQESDLVRQLIDELELADTVFVTGELTHAELRKLYDHCTVFCLPCIVARNGDRDGIPNVLVEAMAMGIPVVSTTVSAIPELVQDGANGLLVGQKDVDALAGALGRLLSDGTLRRRLGDAARETVCGSFDAEKTTTALKDLFASCLAAGVRQ